MKILLIKITSMGDLIQMLPAITDATRAIPGIRFDWLAEESFKEIPRLHPAVDKIITLPYRRWKKNKMQALRSGEVKQFLQQLRAERYDLVIDAQSNLKSAFVTLLAKGLKLGLDSKSVREYGAQFAYQQKITIHRSENHAKRLRQMMATFLGYELPTTSADYGIIKEELPQLDLELPEKFIFVVPIASCDNKLWPEPYWQIVINDIVAKGYDVILPWWSQVEKERSLRLKNDSARIHLLPTLDLRQKASVLAKAVAAISVDTGLAHMAAALSIPNVSVYGPSNPQFCGTYGPNQLHLQAQGPACSPCLKTKCSYEGKSKYQPACLETILPHQVLEAFYSLL